MWLYSWLTARAELQTSIPVHEGFIKRLGNPFFVSTRGLATLDTTISPPAPDFSVIAANPVQQVTHGSAATFQISVLPKHGPFNAAVSLTCSVQPALPCSFDRPSVEPGDTGADLTLTVPTAAAASADLGVIGGFTAIGLVALFVSSDFWRRRIAGAVVLLTLVASCGGGASPPTPAPTPSPTPTPLASTTYRISVAATAGVLTHNATLTLVVQ